MNTTARLALLLVVGWLSVVARAQDGMALLRTRIAQCAVHTIDGPWIPKELYPDGILRFTYLYEPPKKNPGEYDYPDKEQRVYAAFWNSDRTKGELLQFLWLRRTAPIHLRIMNNGHIVTQRGKMDIEDALWGVWTHEHLMRRLARLKVAPLETVTVREIPTRGATCDSFAHVAEGSASVTLPRPQ